MEAAQYWVRYSAATLSHLQPAHPARAFSFKGFFSYGYTASPLDHANPPFNPTSCRTTNNFNVLMAFDSPVSCPSLYFR
jgi:hypothetical protein